MTAATPTSWTLRTPHRARLFANLMGLCTVLVAAHFLWSRQAGWPAWLLLVCMLLAGLHRAVVRKGRGGAWRGRPVAFPHAGDRRVHSRSAGRGGDVPHTLLRMADGHWRVAGNSATMDGSLDHVWYGWGWITLRIRGYARADSITVTVWRRCNSESSWHQLRLWTAWELAMATPSPEVQP